MKILLALAQLAAGAGVVYLASKEALRAGWTLSEFYGFLAAIAILSGGAIILLCIDDRRARKCEPPAKGAGTGSRSTAKNTASTLPDRPLARTGGERSSKEAPR